MRNVKHFAMGQHDPELTQFFRLYTWKFWAWVASAFRTRTEHRSIGEIWPSSQLGHRMSSKCHSCSALSCVEPTKLGEFWRFVVFTRFFFEIMFDHIGLVQNICRCSSIWSKGSHQCTVKNRAPKFLPKSIDLRTLLTFTPNNDGWKRQWMTNEHFDIFCQFYERIHSGANHRGSNQSLLDYQTLLNVFRVRSQWFSSRNLSENNKLTLVH